MLTTTISKAQSFSINTDGSAAHLSAILDVKSTDKGLLIPRMNKIQKNAIVSPATGLLIFQNNPDSVGFHYYDGTKWIYLSSNATDTSAWKITGNSNITGTNFIGTLNDSLLRFRIRNVASGFIDSAKSSTALGYRALRSSTGNGNTAFGYSALDSTSTASFNTAFGRFALSSTVGGSRNTAVGESSLASNTSGSFNTALGQNALASLTAGTYNVALGWQAAAISDATTKVVAIGKDAALYNIKNNITAVGAEALAFNNMTLPNAATDGINNTAVGFQAMGFNIKGSRNTAVGNRALYGLFFANPNSMRNVAVGDSAGAGIFNGAGNLALGSSSLGSINSGNDNVAIGDSAMALAVNTSNNIAIGSKALKSQRANFNNNVAIGHEALRDDTSGTYNVALGYSAGTNPGNLNNSYNTFVGANVFTTSAGPVTNLSIIGYNAGGAYSVSNSVELGNSSVTEVRTAFATSFTNYSDGRIKRNIRDNVPGLNFVRKLRPVSYNVDLHKMNEFIHAGKKTKEFPGMYDVEQKTFNGFIAQEVELATKQAGINFTGLDIPKDPSKELYQLRYGDFVLPLIKSVQELSIENDELRKENEKIKARLDKLEKLLIK